MPLAGRRPCRWAGLRNVISGFGGHFSLLSTLPPGGLDRRFAEACPNPSAWNQFDLNCAYCGAALNNQVFQSVRCKPQCGNIGGIGMPMNMFF